MPSVVSNPHSAQVSPAQARRVYVDCVDSARQDLIAYWARMAGWEVLEGAPMHDDATAANVLEFFVTDRFGPGLEGEITPAELKSSRPAIRMIVLGSGDAREVAQLSLARVAGVDVTLATPFHRDDVLDALRRW
jgi:hypothetical protein